MSKHFLVLACLSLSGCMPFTPSAHLSERSTVPLDLRGVSAVSVNTVNGFIHLDTIGRETSLSVGRRGLQVVSINKVGGVLVIRASASNCPACGADVDLRLPANLRLLAASLSSTNGPIKVEGAFQTRVSATTTNASINVNGARGVDAHTTNAPLLISNLNGLLNVNSTNGSLTLLNVSLPAGSSSSATTTNGVLSALGVRANKGLRVVARTSRALTSVSAPGLVVTRDALGFTATRAGRFEAGLDLETSNAPISLN